MLFESIKIGNLILKNRVIAEPIVSSGGVNGGIPTEEVLDQYSSYASSGVGMIVIEQHAIHPWGRNRNTQFRLYSDEGAKSLQPLTKFFRDADIPVVAQLNFSGAGVSALGKDLLNEPDFKLVSPSGLRNPRDLVEADSEALDIKMIPEIIDSFAQAAIRAVNIAQYNGGVQIYGCHGYLLGQFLSPLTNHRTDKYGGSLQNRARLLLEVTEAVRAVVPNANVSVRLGASDQMPGQAEEGLTLAESKWIAKELAMLGIGWLSISGNHCIYGIGEDDNDTAYFAPYAAAIHKELEGTGIPLDCAGGIRSRKTAEYLLQNGVCDLIGIGRPLLKDREFVHKMK